MNIYYISILQLLVILLSAFTKKPFDSGAYYVHPNTGENLAFSFKNGKLTLDYKGSDVNFIITTEDEKNLEKDESSSSDSEIESSSDEDVCNEKKDKKKQENLVDKCIENCSKMCKECNSNNTKNTNNDKAKDLNTCRLEDPSKCLTSYRKPSKKEELLNSLNKALLIGADGDNTIKDPVLPKKKEETKLPATNPPVSPATKVCNMPKNTSSSFNVNTGYCPSNIGSADITNLSAIKFNQLEDFFPAAKQEKEKESSKKAKPNKVSLNVNKEMENADRLSKVIDNEKTCCSTTLSSASSIAGSKKRKDEPFSITNDNGTDLTDSKDFKTKLRYLKKQMNNKFLKENVKSKFPKLYNTLIDYKYGLSVDGVKICKQDADLVQCRGDFVNFRIVRRQSDFMIKLVENNDITKFYLELCITREKEFDLKLRKCNSNNPYQMFNIKKKKKDCDIYQKEADENKIYQIKTPEIKGIDELTQHFNVYQATEVIGQPEINDPNQKEIDSCTMQKALSASKTIQCTETKNLSNDKLDSLPQTNNPPVEAVDCRSGNNSSPLDNSLINCNRGFKAIENNQNNSCNNNPCILPSTTLTQPVQPRHDNFFNNPCDTLVPNNSPNGACDRVTASLRTPEQSKIENCADNPCDALKKNMPNPIKNANEECNGNNPCIKPAVMPRPNEPSNLDNCVNNTCVYTVKNTIEPLNNNPSQNCTNNNQCISIPLPQMSNNIITNTNNNTNTHVNSSIFTVSDKCVRPLSHIKKFPNNCAINLLCNPTMAYKPQISVNNNLCETGSNCNPGKSNFFTLSNQCKEYIPCNSFTNLNRNNIGVSRDKICNINNCNTVSTVYTSRSSNNINPGCILMNNCNTTQQTLLPQFKKVESNILPNNNQMMISQNLNFIPQVQQSNVIGIQPIKNPYILKQQSNNFYSTKNQCTNSIECYSSNSSQLNKNQEHCDSQICNNFINKGSQLSSNSPVGCLSSNLNNCFNPLDNKPVIENNTNGILI